jgi:glycosyltransferase involved in cell wall biosynthesis
MPVWEPRRDWLRQAVESALAQRDRPVELIVVDDGCPTPVADLLSDIDHPDLHVLRVRHGGVSRARNAGAAAAEGELVRFVDCDDVYPPHSTLRLATLLDDGAPAIAYGATAFCDEDLRPIWTMPATRQGAVARDVLLGRFPFRVQSMLFPRGLLEAVGDWDPGLTVSEDWDYVLRAAELAPARSDRAIATWYRDHAGGLTSDISAGRDGARGVVEGYFDRHPDQRGTVLERRAHAMLEAHAARVDATHGRPLRALRPLMRAGIKDPRAIGGELMRGMPALRGHLRRRLRGRPDPAWPSS